MATVSTLAATYIRMSTNKQEDSPDRQRASTGRAIQREGLTFYQEYLDEAQRGWDNARPAFRQLLTDAQAGKFQVIVVDEVSRLSRNEMLEFFADVAHPLKQAGVRLYAVAEGGYQDWTQLPGVLLSAVYQDRSSGESKKTAHRVTSDYAARSAQGRIDLGKPPYGYKRVWVDGTGKVLHEGTHPPEHVRRLKPTSKLAPGDPAEVEVVRFVFRAYADEDKSLRDIGRELTNRGVPTPAGRAVWSQNCVGKMLREEKYTGAYVFNRRHQGKFSRLGADGVQPAVAKQRRPVQNDREVWRVIPDFHEPLIPAELFKRVQSLLKENRTRTTPSPNRGDYLLVGLVVCDACGSPMSGHRDKKTSPAFYRCTRAMGTAQAVCRNNLVKESEVLDGLLRTVENQFLAPSFLRLLRTRAAELDRDLQSVDRRKALESELASLDRNITRTQGRMALVDDDDTFAVLNSEVTKWTARRRAVRAELAEVGQASYGRRAEEYVLWLERLLKGLRLSLRGSDRGHLRALLRELVDHIKLRVERRLVGKTRHRYFLVGGEVVLRVPGRERYSARNEGVEGLSAGSERATENLSRSEPRACPR
jgi:DNA invertase Pin-like site-specific DNA recombinase